MMKKVMKNLSVFLILCIALTCPAALAGGLTMEAAYRWAENAVEVTGTSGDLPEQAVNLVVVKEGENPADIGKGAVRPAAIRPVKTGENGVFEQTIALSETLDGGYYVVYATSGAGEVQARFLFVNRQQSAPALALLNGARTAGETEQVLRQNAEKFGVTAQQMEGKAAFAAAVAFGRKPASGYPEIYQAVTVIKSALVIKDVIDAPGSPAGVLEKNEELLGISYAQYAALGERTRNKLDALLKKADYTKTDFAQIYQDQLLLARITAAENWSQLQKVALENAAHLGLSMGDGSSYARVNDKDEVFRVMYKKTMASFAEIKKAFDDSVQEVLNSQGKNGPAGGGTGSSGTTSNRQVNADADYVEDITGPKEEVEEPFSDIAGHWAGGDIKALSEAGIVAGFGDGTFRPDQQVTRAEFVKLLVTAFSLSGDGAGQYRDVQSGDWFKPYVDAASALGLITGYDGYFYPSDSLTRQDAAVVIYRTLRQLGKEASGSHHFPDSAEIAEYAREAAGALAAAGIMQGTGSGFEPAAVATRAQVVKMIRNMMEYTAR